MTKTPQNASFLRSFYKVFLAFSAVGFTVAIFFGWRAVLSYFFGNFLLGFLVVLWDWTLALVLDPNHPSPTLGYLLILLRYGLLGGLFYAMIALFVVNWTWFTVGSLTLLPSLLITAFFFDHRPSGTQS